MKAISKVLSCASAAAIAATSVTPAFAYFRSDIVPGYVENVNEQETGRRITSRAIRTHRDQNAPVVGEERTDEAVRASSANSIRKAHRLRPVRGSWRRLGLRGERRRILSRQRGGQYDTLVIEGDEEASLPDALVETGTNNHPNWRSWARGRTGGTVRDLNGANRHDYK